jgi:hypothetical protein
VYRPATCPLRSPPTPALSTSRAWRPAVLLPSSPAPPPILRAQRPPPVCRSSTDATIASSSARPRAACRSCPEVRQIPAKKCRQKAVWKMPMTHVDPCGRPPKLASRQHSPPFLDARHLTPAVRLSPQTACRQPNF